MKKGLLALLIALSFSATAGQLYDVTLPDTYSMGPESLVLNGMGPRKATIFGVKVYVAGLYVAAKTADASAILSSPTTKRLELKFVRDVDAGKIRGAWSEGLDNKENCGGDCAPFKASLATLNASMEDMKVGDTMSFVFRPSGVTVTVKGQAKPEIAGGDFARALLSIWLGSKPPNAELKKGLLGEAIH